MEEKCECPVCTQVPKRLQIVMELIGKKAFGNGTWEDVDVEIEKLYTEVK